MFVCLQTYGNNKTHKKLAYLLRKVQSLRVNNSTKFSGYYFYMN